MIVIDGTKYSCQRCIRGHRVSGCDHYDEELFIIKRKGRPSSMCMYCRRTRQARNNKIKCVRAGPSESCASLTCKNADNSKGCTCAQNNSQQMQTIPASCARALIASGKLDNRASNNLRSYPSQNEATQRTLAYDERSTTYPNTDPYAPLSPPESMCSDNSDIRSVDSNMNSPRISDSVLENMGMNSLSSSNDVPLRRSIQPNTPSSFKTSVYPGYDTQFDLYTLPQRFTFEERFQEPIVNYEDDAFGFPQGSSSFSRMSYLYSH